jgi:hypothetical protein
VAGISQAQVIDCIRDGGEAKGQKALLRGLISAAEKKLSEAPSKAGAEDVSSDKPKGAGSKADADGDDADQERLMGAMVSAATAKDLGKAGQHFRSASLQRVKMRQAGGPTKVNTDGPAGRMTKSGQEKLKKALARGDKKYIDDVMHNLDLEMHQGESPAMTEMAKAAKQAGPQGASARFIPWSKRPQVSPPAAEFSGMRPTIKADQVETPNILFPRWFLRDPNKLLSDSWKPKAKLGDYSWTGDDKKDDVKLLGFTTPDDWFQAATMLQMYAAQTSPPLMGNVVQNQHAAYCMQLKEDMGLHGAGTDRRMLTLYVNYDERMRMHIATATDEVEYTEGAPQLRHEFLEMPRKRLEKIIVDERDAALTLKIAQMKRPAPKRDRAPGGREQPAADAGGGGKPKVGGREGMAIKLLKRDLSEMPYIYKGKGRDRKAACLVHNSGDCHAGEAKCTYGHFCVGCGQQGCSINTCRQSGTVVGGGTPKDTTDTGQKLLGNTSDSSTAADGGN